MGITDNDLDWTSLTETLIGHHRQRIWLDITERDPDWTSQKETLIGHHRDLDWTSQTETLTGPHRDLDWTSQTETLTGPHRDLDWTSQTETLIGHTHRGFDWTSSTELLIGRHRQRPRLDITDRPWLNTTVRDLDKTSQRSCANIYKVIIQTFGARHRVLAKNPIGVAPATWHKNENNTWKPDTHDEILLQPPEHLDGLHDAIVQVEVILCVQRDDVCRAHVEAKPQDKCTQLLYLVEYYNSEKKSLCVRAYMCACAWVYVFVSV